MLSKSHQQELLGWLELLKSLNLLLCADTNNFTLIQNKWYQIQDYLQIKIMTLNSDELDISQQSLFQSWQTETYRYIRLLKTDFLFYQSAKQITTKESRFLVIQQRLNEAINLTDNYLLAVLD
ncbi:MAG: heterocyst frequency control protein PatD [Cyanobacteria bacterium]|nr:heterocyst frequency control protein PatD [Cyanobacteria bacterium CG_2015-16_32_12]NCO77600.1 heterocyst frequency control protein PatD [Cyanobacteria bacterium CG_2015-22_32_23]NCQ05689.1 heterocyst frequency control protein PatD [Cyanobacteria bacterium CG_2015-09_32_10]NCQ41892.1 heterocyst frequency control protein PatD [Cyanobacteria bacterium CG_2015-04_32_10]NCS83446.1 heterocyst frequency control protein PatD [Cyanobacteria bacterium CG_2015-02_32_10]